MIVLFKGLRFAQCANTILGYYTNSLSVYKHSNLNTMRFD